MKPYKLGIKRRFWFGFTDYIIVNHTTEVVGSGAWLVLDFPDGAKLTVPGVHKRTLYVYPEGSTTTG